MPEMKAPARLFLDVGPLQDDHWTGIPVFTRRLARALLASGKVDLSFCVGLRPVSQGSVIAAMRHGAGAFFREALGRERPAEARLPDVAVPLLCPSVKRSFGIHRREASTVHDMSTLLIPETHKPDNVAFHLDHFTEELATNDLTFCVSAATEAALLNAYPSVQGRTATLLQYVDWPGHFAALDRNLPKITLGRYAVVIGTLEPRKNLGLLLRAVAHPEMHRVDLQFVVIGRRGWRMDQFLAQISPRDRERLLFTGFVSEFIKYRLLKHAAFLVYPSLYEGFGIPALEAMSLGKPVLASRTSSLPDVIGPAGLYFDPLSVDDFIGGLREIDHADRLTELAALAFDRSRAFGPARMAAPVLDWLRHA